MKIIASLLLLAGMVSTTADARTPIRPYYMYGAIAYQTVPGGFYHPPTYNVGLAGGYTDAYRAARVAQRDCGWGCGYFTFYNGCAGISFTAPRFGNVANYGFVTSIVPFNGRSESRTRREVRRRLDRAAGAQRVVDTYVQCSN